MTVFFFCECGRKLKAREEFLGKQAACPTCGRTLKIPASAVEANENPEDPDPQTESMPITEFLEPQGAH